LSKHKDEWLKRKQWLPVSDIAEEFVSVTDIKHYTYCPRLIYFNKVLHATPNSWRAPVRPLFVANALNQT